MPPLLLLHMLAGLTAVSAGFAALLLRKGSGAHRRMGILFALAMLAMAFSGAYRAAFVHPQPENVIAGLFTAYLVASGWLAARQPLARADAATLLVTLGGAGLALGAFSFAAMDARGTEAAGAAVVFGTLTLIGVAGDVRLVLRGPIGGARRLRRHLWRVGGALLLATFSLFVGTPNRILPAVLRESPLQIVPALLVLGLLIYAGWRTRAASGARSAPPVPGITPAS